MSSSESSDDDTSGSHSSTDDSETSSSSENSESESESSSDKGKSPDPPHPPTMTTDSVPPPTEGGDAPVEPPVDTEPKDERKIWERPWSLEELRDGINDKWTLAGDAGLLNMIKEMSQNIIQQSKDLNTSVDDLLYDTQATEVKLHNTFNSFLNLAQFQFVENKVYDEDAVVVNDSNTTPEQQAAGDSVEGVDAVVKSKYTEAIGYALKTLEKSTLRDEDEDVAAQPPPEQKKIDYWSKRPLPAIIGTKEFVEDDYVGLYCEESSEEEPIESIYEPGLPPRGPADSTEATASEVAPPTAPPAAPSAAPSGTEEAPTSVAVPVPPPTSPTKNADDIFKSDPDDDLSETEPSPSKKSKKKKEKRIVKENSEDDLSESSADKKKKKEKAKKAKSSSSSEDTNLFLGHKEQEALHWKKEPPQDKVDSSLPQSKQEGSQRGGC